MKILVTGGNGYVGRELCRQLYDSHRVLVVDELRYGANRFCEDDLARLDLIQADVSDVRAMAAVREFAPDVVIHLAAIHYIPECETNPALAVSTNVAGTVAMLQACPPGCRFVFASSGAVYAPDASPHSETEAATVPTDIYGLSKLQGEHYVRYIARARGFPAVIVRLFNVVGPGETNPHLLPEIIAQLKAGNRSIRLGNLWPKRDYIHVRDAARGFAAAALEGAVANGDAVAVNLGTSKAYSVSEVVERLRRISGCQFELLEDSSRVRAVDRPVLAADVGRIRRMFGWSARLSIDDALSDLWREPDLSEALLAKYRS
uniref:UDP-glucose 4-epimerase n=1 Tax=Rhodopseudomonas palustris (strain BisA53) TaxID=316055 RepID=Q07KU6_RHOP5